MSIESTRAVMTRYFNAEDDHGTMLAEDVVYTVMATGEQHRGRAGVLALLDFVYRVAFAATFVQRTVIFADNNALLEGEIVGRHIGEYAGVPATGKDVRLPACVIYDLENDQIKAGRVYIEIPAFLQQIA